MNHDLPGRGALTAALSSRYRIERELGSGGMATVWLAHDVKHDRQVAIKVLREELPGAEGRARFLREIRVSARLQHPNIVPVFDSGDDGGVLWFAMPLVQGETLRARLEREGALPVGSAVRILLDVASALAVAHREGVVHRDVKPENVMLTEGRAMVADFGVARAVTEAREDLPGLTTLGASPGTPAYMAPEQVAGDAAVDHRADQYALGVLAFEMLTGASPFRGLGPAQRLAAQVAASPPALPASVPAALAALVARCLAGNPEGRYPRTDELVSELDRALSAVADGGSARRARAWAAAAVAAAATVVVVGVLAVRIPSAPPPEPDETPAAAALRRGREARVRESWEGFQAAIAHFRQAAALAPSDPTPVAELSHTYALMGYLGFAEGPGYRESLDSAEAAALRAMAMDPGSPHALSAMAEIRMRHHFDTRGAADLQRRAVEASPSDPFLRYTLGEYLVAAGDDDGGLAELRAVVASHPGSADAVSALAWGLRLARRPAEALDVARRALELDPSFAPAHANLAWALLDVGPPQEALGPLRQALALSGGNQINAAFLAYGLALAGERDEALRLRSDLESNVEAGRGFPYYVALVSLGLGDRDAALDWLERAQREGDGHLVFLSTAPMWDPVRDEPRFQAVQSAVAASGATGPGVGR